MAGRKLGAAGGKEEEEEKKAKIIKRVVSLMVIMLLLTAMALSMAPYYSGQLRVFFTRYFFVLGVLTQTTLGFLLARSAATAPTPASRRSYMVCVVACFVNLAINLHTILRAMDAEDAD